MNDDSRDNQEGLTKLFWEAKTILVLILLSVIFLSGCACPHTTWELSIENWKPNNGSFYAAEPGEGLLEISLRCSSCKERVGGFDLPPSELPDSLWK